MNTTHAISKETIIELCQAHALEIPFPSDMPTIERLERIASSVMLELQEELDDEGYAMTPVTAAHAFEAIIGEYNADFVEYTFSGGRYYSNSNEAQQTAWEALLDELITINPADPNYELQTNALGDHYHWNGDVLDASSLVEWAELLLGSLEYAELTKSEQRKLTQKLAKFTHLFAGAI